MKHIYISSLIAFGAITGCATVSMVPGSVMVESSLMAEQSQLRDVSNAYIEQAEAAHWIRPTQDIWSFAKMLANGIGSDHKTVSYADHISLNYTDPDQAVSVINADIEAASTGLSDIIASAETLLASNPEETSLRTDTYSFESVLVTAQKARRNFGEAAYMLGRDYDLSDEQFAAQFATFDAAINLAQSTADLLAEHGVASAGSDAGA